MIDTPSTAIGTSIFQEQEMTVDGSSLFFLSSLLLILIFYNLSKDK